MKLWAVEGNSFRLDGGAMFGNAPQVLWKKWTEADSLNRIPLAGRALLVQTDKGRHILFETGIGTFFPPEMRSRYAIVETEHHLL
ncbi:MAG: MBL fold metallo-hydrolase, partial [Parachlamydia sp.]|nr:MBL fold metallo-hydrolase [Parachlamydia sp.]